MPLTFQDIEKNGLLQELVKSFFERQDALALLSKAEVDEGHFRPFESTPRNDWWGTVCTDIANGEFKNSNLERLFSEAADMKPGNELFKPFLRSTSLPDNRGSNQGNIQLVFPSDIPDDLALRILKLAKETVQRTGRNFVLNLGTEGSSRFHISIEDAQPAEIDRLAREIEQACANLGVQARVTREPYHFRDYYSDPLTAEGPDGQRFALEQLRASTPVKDIARGVMNSYKDEVWPTTKTGQRQQAVIDRVTPEGTVRLDPRQTLHDAGVRPGDTLQVSPERTAGAVDPLLREEALARVRVQVLDHAAANPGFEVEANSLVAPTEYLFRFRASSFAPPLSPGESPRPIELHEVLVELPPDFSVEAPTAWWQTDIFHPNIHPETGLVCLGALRENYQPGLDFGELCKMLVDITAYRNYAFEEGYFNEAAAKWALSEEGQLAIEQAGGFSLIR
jgi:hypothetical protein